MVSCTQQAMALIREMSSAQRGTIPKYNEEVIRLAKQEIELCYTEMLELKEEAKKGSARQAQEQGVPEPDFEWANHPEHFAAVMVHHETILRLKRILLTYIKMRADRLRNIWLEKRHIPQSVEANLSPGEIKDFRQYASSLNKYMGCNGIGMDLAVDMPLTTDIRVAVRVLKDHGTLATSGSESVALVKGSTHHMLRADAAPLIRLGIAKQVRY